MPMTLTEILGRTRTVAREVAAKEAEDVDASYQWAGGTMRALQEAGLAGLVIQERHGGLGQGLFALSQVCEILGAECGSCGLSFGMHHVGAAVIAAKPTPVQVDEFLGPICQGKHITTLALSEPGTGSHFYFPQTGLKHTGNGELEINGTKTFVTNGRHADSYVVSTVGTESDAPSFHFSCVVIPKDTANMEWTGEWKGLGMRGNSSVSCDLKNVRVPAANLLGEEGDQLWYVFNVVTPYFLVAMSGTYLGIAQAAINEAIAHISNRSYEHSGSRLADISVIQHKLGRLWARLESVRSLLHAACASADRGDPNALPQILASKAEVGTVAVDTVNEAMTLIGGIGYRENSKLARLLRDVRAVHVMAPTTDILYTWIGRSLLGQQILG
jgi:alkylation response protein AidB-like acyl-CoA dehydrogenase